MQAEILLTLKLQQKLFADPRRISLLKHIALSGSISQGAKDAGKWRLEGKDYILREGDVVHFRFNV